MFFTSTGRLIVDYFLLGSLTVRLSGTVFYLISTDTAACGGFAAVDQVTAAGNRERKCAKN